MESVLFLQGQTSVPAADNRVKDWVGLLWCEDPGRKMSILDLPGLQGKTRMLPIINVRFALDSTFEFTLSAERRRSVHESKMRIVTRNAAHIHSRTLHRSVRP